MIKYFLKSGDEAVSNMFSPYLWKEKGLGTLLDKCLDLREYGNDLSLIQIRYYVVGKFEVNGPVEPKVGNYSKIDKSIVISITVNPDDFHNQSEETREEFVAKKTVLAVELALQKLEKVKLVIDRKSLLLRLMKCLELWKESRT